MQRKTPVGVDVEEVKVLVVKGVSISAAINRLISAKEGEKKAKKGEKQGQGERKSGEEVKSENELRLRRVMKDKDDKIEMLERLNTALKAKVEEKKLELKKFHSKFDSMRSAIRREIEMLREEVKARDEENAELRGIIEELKGKREILYS